MNEKKYNKKIEFQNKLISRQSEQIKSLNAQIIKLKLEIEKKDNIINSVAFLKEELKENVAEVKKGKAELKKLISEVKNMKEIMNQEIFKGRWWLVKYLIKLSK